MAAQTTKNLKRRLICLGIVFGILFIAIVARAFHLQIMSAESLKGKAERQHTAPEVLFLERGNIYDRNGARLAVSVMAKSIFADPAKIKDPAAAAAKLAPLLNLDQNFVLRRLSQDNRFAWLSRKVDHQTSLAVEKLDIPGIYLIDEPRRHYPNNELAGQLLGFVGTDSKGLAGLESRFESQLNGTLHGLSWIRDARGRRLYYRRETAGVERDEPLNVMLTIDRQIQHIVETQLATAVTNKEAKGGIAIAMDIRTGKILAMASSPTFNPNQPNRTDARKSQISPVTKIFDPGSTFKAFLFAAALEEGIIKDGDRFYCEQGEYVVANHVIREAQRKRFGLLTIREIMQYSSNIGSVKIGERLGRDKLHDYLVRFGFGARTGIDLPGEASGLLREPHRWTTVDTANISFGQGISVTAIQLLAAFSAIANNGLLMRPYVVKKIFDNDMSDVREFGPTPVRQVISPATAQTLTSILMDAVSAPGGTGRNAQIMNVSVAGKTGTAQKFDFQLKKYSSERVISSFIGFFPADNPRISLFVMLDEPGRDRWGGVASAPVFRNIGTQIFTSLRNDIIDFPSKDKIEELSPAVQFRLVTSQQNTVDRNLIPKQTDDTGTPDFRGMTVREVLQSARRKGIQVEIIGNGWAVHQEPAAGTPLGTNPRSRVSFSPGT